MTEITKSSTTGVCRLCPNTAQLERGHLIPAFIYRWLRESSATGYMRRGDSPNLRVQDGDTRYWFCGGCEDRMSEFERAFAERLFPLILDEAQGAYSYGSWLSRFLASVAFRTLLRYSEEANDGFGYMTAEQQTLVPQALDCWRRFVLGELDDPEIHELHLLPMGAVMRFEGTVQLPPTTNPLLTPLDRDACRRE